MKSILKLGMAIAVVAGAIAVQVGTTWASTPGDSIFFSTSATDPNAGSTLNLTGTGTLGTLYIWVTSAGGTTDATNDAITPVTTTYNGNVPTGASAMAINGALTGVANANITSVFYNNPALSNGLNRWSAVSDSTAGSTYTQWNATSFTNLEANAALPTGAPVNSGNSIGLSTANAFQTGDPLYFNVQVPNGSTNGAWRVAQVNVTTTAAAGASTLTLSAGSLGVTKSTTGVTTDMTSFYSYGTATISLTLGRLGDLNHDGNINASDIDILGGDVRDGLTFAQATALGRNDNLLNNPDSNALVSQADMDHEVGSLIDVNGVPTSVGTHYGDADLNGVVNQLDLNAVSQNFLKTGQGWANGNFTGTTDTVVNQNDLNQVSQNFLKTGGTGQVAAVPEPASCVLFSFAAISLLGIARRRSR